MKSQLGIATLLISLGLTNLGGLVAETPPASTYQPGFWQPTARVDLTKPLSIQIINEADVALEYDFTNIREIPPQPIEPGATITIKEQIPIPAYLLINRSSFVEFAEGFNLNFDVTVSEDNVIKVIVTKVDTDTLGYSTVNLHETGAIYIY